MASGERGRTRIDLVVIARILDALYTNGKLRRTKLQMYSRLNYPRFSQYLNWLLERNLVEFDGDYVKLTRVGVEAYERVVRWMKEVIGRL